MKKLCVGIDVAKNKFDVCFTIDGEKYFGYTVFSNSKHGLKDLVTLSKKYKKEFKADKIHFCMEATGIFLKLFSLKPVAHVGFTLVFALVFANRLSAVHNFATTASFVNIYRNILL